MAINLETETRKIQNMAQVMLRDLPHTPTEQEFIDKVFPEILRMDKRMFNYSQVAATPEETGNLANLISTKLLAARQILRENGTSDEKLTLLEDCTYFSDLDYSSGLYGIDPTSQFLEQSEKLNFVSRCYAFIMKT